MPRKRIEALSGLIRLEGCPCPVPLALAIWSLLEVWPYLPRQEMNTFELSTGSDSGFPRVMHLRFKTLR